MPQRLRVLDLRLSRLPKAVGLCASDLPGLLAYLNAAEPRLLYAEEAGEEGWFGTWAEMIFTVRASQPYLTAPRRVARLEYITVCDKPVEIQNQFYEYLRFGNGRLPKACLETCRTPVLRAYSRNNAVLFKDISSPPQLVKVYRTDAADIGKRVLIQGLDSNGNNVYEMDGSERVDGEYLTFADADTFALSTYQWNALNGIQKDLTDGPVQIFQVDPSTGVETLLSTMEPGEKVASYRRYYFNPVPPVCCVTSALTEEDVTVSAIVKLDHVPLMVDTDYTVIQNLEAFIEECQAIRYSTMDSIASQQLSQVHHKRAIKLLNGELAHYLGKQQPAVIFAPFGSAPLIKRKVGTLI